MKTAVDIMIFMLFCIPVFAFFLLVKRYRESKHDNGARDRFLESLIAEHSKEKSSGTADKVSEPAYESSEPEELDESIILAKKIAAETFAATREDTVPDTADNEKNKENVPEQSFPAEPKHVFHASGLFKMLPFRSKLEPIPLLTSCTLACSESSWL